MNPEPARNKDPKATDSGDDAASERNVRVRVSCDECGETEIRPEDITVITSLEDPPEVEWRCPLCERLVRSTVTAATSAALGAAATTVAFEEPITQPRDRSAKQQ